MKKILAMFLALSLMFAFTACGDEASVQVNSLTPKQAFTTYVTSAYTTVGYSMNFSYDFNGVSKSVAYSALYPSDPEKLQYSYVSDKNKFAYVSEVIDGAKLKMFYVDDGTSKVATETPAATAATKANVLSDVTMISIFDDIQMKLNGEGNMTFTCTGVSNAFEKMFPEIGQYKTISDDLKKVTYVYNIEDAKLKSLEIKGSFEGKEFKAEATNFQVISDKKASLKFADSDSYKQVIQSDLEELAKEQEEAEKKAEEAKTSEKKATTAQ